MHTGSAAPSPAAHHPTPTEPGARPLPSTHTPQPFLVPPGSSPHSSAAAGASVCVCAQFLRVLLGSSCLEFRVGQNRIYTPYLTVCMENSLLSTLFTHRVCVCMYRSGRPHSNFRPVHGHATPLRRRSSCFPPTHAHAHTNKQTHT